MEHGTSADRQLDAYRTAKSEGASNEEALHAVVDHLREETMRGIGEKTTPQV
ncbi:MAG: hypothetical protein AAFQ07_17695 [Chloroflexota bacterium]